MASVESLSWLQQAALSAQAVFYGVTVVGLLLTALFGVVKYRLFRSGRPFITITLITTTVRTTGLSSTSSWLSAHTLDSFEPSRSAMRFPPKN